MKAQEKKGARAKSGLDFIFLITGFFLVLTTPAVGKIKNHDTFIFATYGNLRTLDPCAAYDTNSSQRIWNLYEPLIFFDGPHTDQFKPVLARQVPSTENGGISPDGKRYAFVIRKGIRFHEGQGLKAEDVVYSFKRNMIADPDGGPMWMLLEALTGESSTRDRGGRPLQDIFGRIDRAVRAEGDRVVFLLPKPYPPFLSVLAHTSAVVLNKSWAVSKGCWDGRIENASRYNNPAPGHEPLQRIANGTQAYRMKAWEPNKQFVFDRFEGYWGPKPALKTAIIKYVKEWSTRKLMLQNGDADRVTVDMPHVPEVQNMKGLKIHKVPQLSVSGALFCQRIDPTGNPNIGSGKLDGKGIPPDFFSDIHMRKAFLHAMDRNTYREDVFHGWVILPSSPNIEGLPYHKKVPVYEFDLKKSAAHMKRAWQGKVWKKGFKMVILYNTGNEMREAAALMLAENIMSLSPKFRIELRQVEWKDYLVKYRNYRYPLFITGWAADYADPHNFLYTFMHSRGVYGRFMAYKNEAVDRLCEAGIETMDPERRKTIYGRLQDLWFEEALGIMLYQQINIRAYRDWVKGYIPNPMLTDANEMLMNLRKE